MDEHRGLGKAKLSAPERVDVGRRPVKDGGLLGGGRHQGVQWGQDGSQTRDEPVEEVDATKESLQIHLG